MKTLASALLLLSVADGARLGLHQAAQEGQVAPLKVAIDGRYDEYAAEWKKPDINGQNKKGHIALHLAVCNQRGDPVAVRTLLEKGADANARDGNDDTALHVAVRMCKHASAPVAQLFAEGGAVQCVKMLLKS